MKGYFGGKEVLKVLLGDSVIYSKKGGEVLPPPETITVSRTSFLSAFISYSTNPPTEATSYSANARMTDWVEVRPNSSYSISTYLTNTCVIQVKDASGTITNLTQFSGAANVNGIVFPTGDNVFVRVYFYVGGSGTQARELFLTEQRS